MALIATHRRKMCCKRAVDVNVTGLFATTKKAVELMKKNQNGGAIVNTSSMAGVAGSMNNIGYTASKFAVEGLTLGMARELGRYHIRVNGVAPAGMIKTDVDFSSSVLPLFLSLQISQSH